MLPVHVPNILFLDHDITPLDHVLGHVTLCPLTASTPCQSKTGRTNSRHASSPSAPERPSPRNPPTASSNPPQNSPHQSPSSRAWPRPLQRTLAAPPSSSPSSPSVSLFPVTLSLLSSCSPVAKRKTLFDDRPVEISVSRPVRFPCLSPGQPLQELTFIIKQDIAHINKQIATLQTYVKQRNVQASSKSVEGKQIDEHNSNVVMLLQSKLASTSMTFKDVLEVRTQVGFHVFLQAFS